MNLSCVIIYSILISFLTVVVANENVNLKNNLTKKGVKDELPIDDEDAEGSGLHESPFDVESSGSGDGPYDDTEFRSGLIAHGDVKSNKVHSGGSTIPTTSVSTSPAQPMPSSTASIPKHNSESTQLKILKTEKNENTNVVTLNNGGDSNNNNNPETSEDEYPDQERVHTRKGLVGDTIFEDRRPDSKVPTDEDSRTDNNGGVSKINPPDRDRATSFFAQPGILAAIIGGAVVGLLCAILVVMFIVYRMRKKDEGSYPLEEMKRCPVSNPYMKPNHREFFA